jgi:general secretion pathway protein I
VKGFTLLEVLIALAIMAGVVMTLIASFNYHLGIVNRDREESVAVLLARAKLDDPDFKKVTDNKGSFAPQWPNYSWKTEQAPTDYPGIQRLVLTVFWDGERRSLSLVQYQAKQ